MRKAALRVIIKGYLKDPQTLALLSDRTNNDPDQEVRKFAAGVKETLEEGNNA
ncbi:MAG: hypothetical protein F6K19_34920 [Cyanothece sp. SIO1E1]|nr:hypothetical protein [Cyanothece sp. SIO1E1]